MSAKDRLRARLSDPVVWSDVENGAYSADLPVWEELTAKAKGPVLELGCGSGRVALHLGGLGHEVLGVDARAELVRAVNDRARASGAGVEALVADIRSLELGRRFGIVLGPMQVVHMLATGADRLAMLRGVADHLAPEGIAAFALLDEDALGDAYAASAEDLVPDIREEDGWVYSSRPLSVRSVDGGLEVHGLRQVVAPGGEIAEAEHVVRLIGVTVEEFEGEAREAGLAPLGHRGIEPTEAHMGSTVVVVEGSD